MERTVELQIRKALQEELIRRLLRQYFDEKGITKKQLEHKAYPPMLQDLPVRIPQLQGKVEVVPFIEELDPQTGQVQVGWNLFVLGNRRMFLGQSGHKNLAELKMAMNGPTNQYPREQKVSHKQIIEFVSRVLGSSEAGKIPPKVDKPASIAPSPMGPGLSSRFYAGSQGFEQNKPVL